MEAAYDPIAEWYAARVQADSTADGSWTFPPQSSSQSGSAALIGAERRNTPKE